MIELFDILKWYFLIQLIGGIGFLSGFNLFATLSKRGFCVSKTFGLLLIAIISWFISNQTLQIVPYSSFSVYLILIGLGVFAFYKFKSNKDDVINFLKDNQKYILSLETAFLIAFLLFTVLRSYTPNIEGTEKPHEFVVFQSILSTNFFPPNDVWLSNIPINYYYLGQAIFSNVIKLTFIDQSVAFNLVNPTIMALIVIGTFGFIYQLTKSIPWSILAVYLTAFVGNFEPIIQIFYYGWNPNTFRWWDAGHIIPNSFPEFPYWSFLHSDVHAHFLVHPFTILFLFLILTFIYDKKYILSIEDFKIQDKFLVNIFYCTILGSFMLINSWNYPSSIALTIAALFIQQNQNNKEKPIIINIIKIIPISFFYIFMSYGIYLAFYSFYTSPISGIGIVDWSYRTTAIQFLVLLGLFLFPLLIYLAYNYTKTIITDKNKSIKTKIILNITVVSIIAAVYFISKSFIITLSAIFIVFLAIKILNKNEKVEINYVMSILFLLFCLTLACEVIYVNDLFSGENERQNTVAKSYIQILLLMPMVTTYIMYLINKNSYLKGFLKQIYLSSFTIMLIIASLFLVVGTYVKNNKFERVYGEQNWHIPTLNGSKYINIKYDGDYDGIMWLRQNANKNDVVLEVEGGQYSYFGRVSSHSGVPCPLNWAGSLSVLRGNDFGYISGPRSDAIHRIYSTINKHEIMKLLRKYHISYIFIGSLEKIAFTQEQLGGFDKQTDSFEKVFTSGNTDIYRVK